MITWTDWMNWSEWFEWRSSTVIDVGIIHYENVTMKKKIADIPIGTKFKTIQIDYIVGRVWLYNDELENDFRLKLEIY